ncbi:MAG: SpaA isopeptide-forming pilin-related protein, partial [Anaerococcus hydrogenalis]|nr:SpaA isopeptide-forming pilin-related protein [Anaerococcus hydrogenalis]
EFELNKTDDENNPLEGVKFKLYDTEGKEVKTDITNSDGKIKFSDLPFGSYWLKEINTKNGYIIDTKKRLIALGGGDWKVPDKKLNDVSKAITFDGVQEELVSTADIPDSKTVYPNKAEGMVANFKFNIDPEKEIKPGDYFTIHFSDNVDLDGIFRDNDDNGEIPDSRFDIIGSAGKLAEAKVNDDRKSITYTFTDYVENYRPESMAMYLQIFADRRLIDHKQDIRVTADIGDNTDNENNDYHYSDSINIDYRGYNYKEEYNGYQNPNSDISSYNLRLNPDDKTFTAIVYYNPWNKYLTNKNIRFTTDKEIDQESLSVKTYVKYGSGSHKNEWQQNDLPDSYDVDFNRSDLEYIGDQYRYMGNVDQNGYYNGNTNEILIPQNYLNEDGYEKNTYVIEIKGKLASDTAYSLNTVVHYADHNVYELANDGWYYYKAGYTGHFETWSQFFNPGAIGDVTNEISLVNFKNKIEYTKINGGIRGVAVDKKEDQGENSNSEKEEFLNGVGDPLDGAKFELRIKPTIGEVKKVEGSERTSDKNGKFFWEKLAPGKYEVWEIEAPEGFKKPDKAVSEFEVDKNGNIINIKAGKLTIENNKNAQIRIKKTDENGKPLDGAEFLLTQKTGSEEYGSKIGVVDKTNNTIVFDDIPVGTYELEEKRAPKGFIKSNKIWNIEVRKDGTVKWLNSFDDSKDTMSTIKNPSYLGENATNITSEVIG